MIEPTGIAFLVDRATRNHTLLNGAACLVVFLDLVSSTVRSQVNLWARQIRQDCIVQWVHICEPDVPKLRQSVPPSCSSSFVGLTRQSPKNPICQSLRLVTCSPVELELPHRRSTPSLAARACPVPLSCDA